MTLRPYTIREHIIASARTFLSGRGYREATVPVLSGSLPAEPTLHPFATAWQTVGGTRDAYLAVSPEASLKKLMAMGYGDCFAFGHSFRNIEEAGATHLPEFLMLEWYRQGTTYTDIMDEIRMLILHAAGTVPGRVTDGSMTYMGRAVMLGTTWKRVPMTDLFRLHAGIDLLNIIDDKRMRIAAADRGYSTTDATWEQLFNQIFLNEIEPHLGDDPVYVTDFPSRISPLCRPHRDEPRLCERFELYIGGMELANGNTERTDGDAVERVFEAESDERRRRGEMVAPIDRQFIHALHALTPASLAGIGIGIDRLAMLLSDVPDIGAVTPLSYGVALPVDGGDGHR